MKMQKILLAISGVLFLILFVIATDYKNAYLAWMQYAVELEGANHAWSQWETEEAENRADQMAALEAEYEAEKLAIVEELENRLIEIEALNDRFAQARDEMAVALTTAGVCNENFVLGIGEGTVQFWTDADIQLPKCAGWYNTISADVLIKDYFNGEEFCDGNIDHWIPASPMFSRDSYLGFVEGDSITEWASMGAYIQVGGDYLEPAPDDCLLP